MNHRIGLVLTFILLNVISTQASATLLEIVTTDSDWSSPATLALGGAHDVAVTQGQTGWYNANLRALENVELTFTYLGKEAGWTNAVFTGGFQLFNTSSGAAGDEANGGTVAAGAWIDFVIQILTGGNSSLSVTNGANVAPTGVAGNGAYGAPNFWLGYVDESHDSVYVAFDDGGGGWQGRIDDNDHDDLVFQITAVSVPEPSTLAMLGFGLLLSGFAARRRNGNAGTALHATS